MKKKKYSTTYKEAFEEVIGIPFDEKLKQCVKYLEKEGYAERNIAYVIWLRREKLFQYSDDSRFCSILQNEVRIHGKTQAQWNEYWRNKNKEQFS